MRSHGKLKKNISTTAMPMATKPGRVVTYNKELPSIKSRPFYHVVMLMILISFIEIVGLERKCLGRHRLLVIIGSENLIAS